MGGVVCFPSRPGHGYHTARLVSAGSGLDLPCRSLLLEHS